MKEHNTNENTYVKKVSYQPESPLNPLRTFALQTHVPIIGDEVLRFLELMVSIKAPARILEVGTAIGYSAAAMLLCSEAELVSIEREESMHKIACDNLRALGLEDRARLLFGDASELLSELADDAANRFDFAFIDASKAHYLEHFLLAEPMLNEGALVLFDNVLYLGLLAGRRTASKNNTIRNRMQDLIDYCFRLEGYRVSMLQAEDGLLILHKQKRVSK
ncbi:MAG: O-methyltransferase [Bacillota bacterium]|nr:O-methyltransferase [Bacillota bacterium]